MKLQRAKRVKRKIAAREWIIAAIQNYSRLPDKPTQSEVKRFIRRIQRDLVGLKKAEIEADLMIAEAETLRRFDHAIR